MKKNNLWNIMLNIIDNKWQYFTMLIHCQLVFLMFFAQKN